MVILNDSKGVWGTPSVTDFPVSFSAALTDVARQRRPGLQKSLHGCGEQAAMLEEAGPLLV